MPEQLIAPETLRQDLYGAIEQIQDEALDLIMDGLGLTPDDFDWVRPKSSPYVAT